MMIWGQISMKSIGNHQRNKSLYRRNETECPGRAPADAQPENGNRGAEPLLILPCQEIEIFNHNDRNHRTSATIQQLSYQIHQSLPQEMW
jgi:hypothetical protein